MIFIGLDPSLTGFGWAVLEHPDTVDGNRAPKRILRAGVWETEPDHTGKTKAADNGQRLTWIAERLWTVLEETKPNRIFVEGTIIPLGKTRWTTISLLGRCRGLIDMAGIVARVGVTEMSPQSLKSGLGILTKEVKGMASKEEVRARVVKLYPEAEALIPNGKVGENASDAIAAAHVGLIAQEFKERLRAW